MSSKILRGGGRHGRGKGTQEEVRGADTGPRPNTVRQGVDDLEGLKERIQEELPKLRVMDRRMERMGDRSRDGDAESPGAALPDAAIQVTEILPWPSLDAPVPPPYEFDDGRRSGTEVDKVDKVDRKGAGRAPGKPPVFAATLLGVPVAKEQSRPIPNQIPDPISSSIPKVQPIPTQNIPAATPTRSAALVLHNPGGVPQIIGEFDPTTVNPSAAAEAYEMADEQGFGGHLPWYEQSPRAEEVFEQPEKNRTGRALLGVSLGLILAVVGFIAARRAFLGPPESRVVDNPTAKIPGAENPPAMGSRDPALIPPEAPPPIAPAPASPPSSASVVLPPSTTRSGSNESNPLLDGTREAPPTVPPPAARTPVAMARPTSPPQSSALSKGRPAPPLAGTRPVQPRQRSASAAAPAAKLAPASSAGATDRRNSAPPTPLQNAAPPPGPSVPSFPVTVPPLPGANESSFPKASADRSRGKPNYDPDSTLPLNVD